MLSPVAIEEVTLILPSAVLQSGCNKEMVGTEGVGFKIAARVLIVPQILVSTQRYW